MQNMAGPQAQSGGQPHKLLVCMSEPQHTCTCVQGRFHCCTQRSIRIVKGQESLFQGAGSLDPHQPYKHLPGEEIAAESSVEVDERCGSCWQR